MKKATMSFEEKRKAILQAAEQNCGQQTVSKTITFSSDVIPTFLKDLRKFQEESRKVRIVAK